MEVRMYKGEDFNEQDLELFLKTPEITKNCVVTRKFDGSRIRYEDGKVYSTGGSTIVNRVLEKHIVAEIDKAGLQDFVLDAEFVYIDENGLDDFEKSSLIRKKHSTSEDILKGHHVVIFDCVDVGSYNSRFISRFGTKTRKFTERSTFINFIETHEMDALEYLYPRYEQLGREGFIIRDINSTYKPMFERGYRATDKQYDFRKIKYTKEWTGIISDIEKKKVNNNQYSKENAFGTKVKETKKEFIQTEETVGALICYVDGIGEITVGSGLNDELRKDIYLNFVDYYDKPIVIKARPAPTKNGLLKEPRIIRINGKDIK